MIPLPKKWAQTMFAEVLREVWILRRRQPFGEHIAAILAVDVRRISAEEFRRHHASADRMRHLAAAAVEDDPFARVFGLLSADLGEEGGEAVVIVHRPAIERMIMALRALNAHAHEDLGGVFRQLQSVRA